MKITRHAQQRTKERIALPKRARVNLASKARTKGIGLHNTQNPKLIRYLNELLVRHNFKASHVYLYVEKVWIFCDDTLLTVYCLPAPLRRPVQKETKAAQESEESRADPINPAANDRSGS